MPYPEFTRPSPNRSLAPPNERLGVAFHHSVLGFEETLARMARRDARVSYHCLIAGDGTRCALVPDRQVAWHAGASRFLGREGANGFLLGVAFAGDTYRAPLTGPQIASALEWLARRWAACAWSIGRMTDHRQIAPGRKADLHPREWERLRAAIAARFPA